MLYTPEKRPAACVGCFGCWLKTPGKCVLRDGFEDLGVRFSQTDELICVSRCCFGGFSPFVKAVMDRSIPYGHPFFEVRGGTMHHQRRYDNVITASAYFYGKGLTEAEKQTARDVLEANVLNLDGKTGTVAFFESPDQLREVVF